jgi:hypothetical protein
MKNLRHKRGGNCRIAEVGRNQVVCPKHDQPRGECQTCPRCPVCDNSELATSLGQNSHPADPLAPIRYEPLWQTSCQSRRAIPPIDEAPMVMARMEYGHPMLMAVIPPGGPSLPIDDLSLITPTASKTDLFLACSWPWGRKARKDPVGERTRFGIAFHECMAWRLASAGAALRKAPISKSHIESVAVKFDVDPNELADRAAEAHRVLDPWLRGDNTWGINFLPEDGRIDVEQSVAYDPTTDMATATEPPDEVNHEYPNVPVGSIPGTADLVAVVVEHDDAGSKWRTVLVLDHKSGWNVAADWQPQTPAESGQLRTLALALCRLHDADRAIVAFFHAPAGGVPIVLADTLDANDLEKHRKALQAAQKRVGNGWLHPDHHCTYCPAWSICPTNTTSLVELKRQPGPLSAERVGAIHQAAAEYDRLRERLRDEMRAWVVANGVGVRPDGQFVDLVEKEVTGLSQASIIRALGKLEGAKTIEKLRKLGAVETKTRIELRAVKR